MPSFHTEARTCHTHIIKTPDGSGASSLVGPAQCRQRAATSPGWQGAGMVQGEQTHVHLQTSASGWGSPRADAKPWPWLGGIKVQKQSWTQRSCSSATCPCSCLSTADTRLPFPVLTQPWHDSKKELIWVIYKQFYHITQQYAVWPHMQCEDVGGCGTCPQSSKGWKSGWDCAG